MKPLISSKFVGPAKVRDLSTGLFWEVLPAFSAHEERLQLALINAPSRLAQTRNEVNALCPNRFLSPKPQPAYELWQISATPRESSDGTNSTN